MIGSVVAGGYRVVDGFAAGTVATLWRVDGPLGTAVLKVVPGESGRAARRFEVESRALSMLPSHPGLPRLLSVDLDSEGTGRIIETLAPGESLRTRLTRAGPPGTETAKAWCGSIASALDALHSVGLVHCDVKPENLVIDGDGPAAAFVLVDFGLATPSGERCVVQEGTAAGTPRYMAPEQVRGEAVDARSDVYALGLVTYELLTGEPPFLRSPNVDVRTQQLQSHPVPPSLVAFDGAVDDVTSEVVLRALRKVPSARFESAGAFARALRTS